MRSLGQEHVNVGIVLVAKVAAPQAFRSAAPRVPTSHSPWPKFSLKRIL